MIMRMMIMIMIMMILQADDLSDDAKESLEVLKEKLPCNYL